MLLLKARVEEAEKLKGEREGEAIASKKRAVELEAGTELGGGEAALFVCLFVCLLYVCGRRVPPPFFFFTPWCVCGPLCS